MGASRPRIVRQLLTETALLTIIAGAAGLAVYALVYRALRDGLVDADVGPTWTTALVTALVAIGTSMLCGLSPALHATRDGVSGVLKDSARTATVKSRLQRTFVVAQIALTQPLLVMLALMIVAVLRQGDFAHRQSGEHIVRASFDTWSAVARDNNRMSAIIERVSSLPGVVAVIPQVSGIRSLKLDAPPLPSNPVRRYVARTHQVPPGYFKGMDQRIVRGREFVESDSMASVSPIVIGSDFAARVFGAENPIGKRLVTLSWRGSERTGEAEIVGVVSADDAGSSEIGTSIRIFTPMGGPLGVPGTPDALLIRTTGPAAPLLPTLREIARAEAPMLPIRSMKTLAQMDREKRSEIVQATGASAVGGLITLLLASIGPVCGRRVGGQSAAAGDRRAHLPGCPACPGGTDVLSQWITHELYRVVDRSSAQRGGVEGAGVAGAHGGHSAREHARDCLARGAGRHCSRVPRIVDSRSSRGGRGPVGGFTRRVGPVP
jgi:hypothetical protein